MLLTTDEFLQLEISSSPPVSLESGRMFLAALSLLLPSLVLSQQDLLFAQPQSQQPSFTARSVITHNRKTNLLIHNIYMFLDSLAISATQIFLDFFSASVQYWH